jgi:hypothetical protein
MAHHLLGKEMAKGAEDIIRGRLETLENEKLKLTRQNYRAYGSRDTRFVESKIEILESLLEEISNGR